MKAAVIDAPGALPHVSEQPEPLPGANEVLVHVKAAGIHPVVRAIAGGDHYFSGRTYPVVCGVDGVGTLESGERVYFGGFHGTMAERAVANKGWLVPVPDGLGDVEAAALLNPGMSSWMALRNRAQLQAGETVLILGATGVAGKLAVQIAKHLGAGRVVAVGRNEQVLAMLLALGADAVISPAQSDQAVIDAFAAEACQAHIDIVLDFLWGHPAELLLSALTSHDASAEWKRTRFVQIGNSAGATITFAAEALRSTGIEMIGSGGGSVPFPVIFATIPQLLALGASGALQIEAEVRSAGGDYKRLAARGHAGAAIGGCAIVTLFKGSA